MHLVSTINPLSKSEGNVPVALFYFNEKGRFIRVSEDYQDTTRRVCQAFNIADTAVISFQTSTLDVCKGRGITIDDSAYPLMWTSLDEINVVIDEVLEAPRQLPTPLVTPTLVQKTCDADSGQHDYLSEDVNVGENVLQEDEEERNREPEERDLADEKEEIYEPPRTMKVTETVDDKGEGGSKLRKKFKPVPATDVGSSMTSDDYFPQVKKEKITHPISSDTPEVQRPDKGRHKTNQVPAKTEDPRFEITITGPEPEYLVAQFKTRGKHLVRKVLEAACKSFDVDYKQAHLLLAVSLEDEDGKMQTHEFDCPHEDTMSQCGVSASSKLFIKVDEEHENDELADSD